MASSPLSPFIGQTARDTYLQVANEALDREARRLGVQRSRAPEGLTLAVTHPGVLSHRRDIGPVQFVAFEPALAVLRGLGNGFGPEAAHAALEKAAARGELKLTRANSPCVLQVGDQVRVAGGTATVFGLRLRDPHASEETYEDARHIEWSSLRDHGADVAVLLTGNDAAPVWRSGTAITPHDGHRLAPRAELDYLGHFAQQAERAERAAQRAIPSGRHDADKVGDFLLASQRASALKALVLDADARRFARADQHPQAMALAAERRAVRQRIRDVFDILRRQRSFFQEGTGFGASRAVSGALVDEREALRKRLRALNKACRATLRPSELDQRVLMMLRGKYGEQMEGVDDATALERYYAFFSAKAQDNDTLLAHLRGGAQPDPELQGPAPRR